MVAVVDDARDRRRVLRWLQRGALALVGLAVLDYFALPQIAGARTALRLLSGLKPWLAGTAVLAEGLSLTAYSMTTRALLGHVKPRFNWVIRVDLSALGLGHVLPGGAATSAALRYRLLRDAGTTGEETAVAIAVEGVGSNLVLAALLWVSLVCSILFLGMRTTYVIVAVLGTLAVVVGIGLLVQHRRRPTSALAGVTRRLPARVRPRFEHAITSGAEQLGSILANRRTLRTSGAWALAYLLLDAASLWISLAVYGYHADIVGLLVAYGVANLVAVVPLSPGGLGLLEAVMIPSLIGFGAPSAIAALGVVTWRLFNFWAPIPVGGLCYGSLRVQQWAHKVKVRRLAGSVGA